MSSSSLRDILEKQGKRKIGRGKKRGKLFLIGIIILILIIIGGIILIVQLSTFPAGKPSLQEKRIVFRANVSRNS